MYKLILVDDEEEVRKGVIKKIDWEKYGFEVVGEAENGKEALEIIEKTIPDIVITDIRMPFMDGLELSNQLMNNYPTTKIIILTGFDEFEYAQKAVKYNVVEYALKPISSDELIEILERIKIKLDKEMEEKEDFDSLRKLYIKSLPIMKEKFLTNLITGSMDKNEIVEKINYFELNLKGSSFVVSAIKIDSSSLYSIRKEWNEDYKNEILKLAVLNIINEIIEKHDFGTAFIFNDYIILLSSCDKEDDNVEVERVFSVLEEIRLSVEKYLKFTITIGVGTVCSDIGEIRNSYQNALTALDYKLVVGKNRIIYIVDIEPKIKDKIVFDDEKENSIISSIKVGTEKDIREVIEGIFEELIERKASFNDYQIYLMEIITAILKASRSVGVELNEVFEEEKNLFLEVNRLASLIEIKDWMMDICIKIMNFINKDRIDTCRVIVDKAIKYAKNNYHEKDITINKICQHLHISPTYFSLIFKKETEKTFINYLTQVRMEASKELLRSTSLKTFEISEKVGYSDQNYFSYSFKKYFGISPSSYRNSFKEA